eukprot:GFYU01009153.1.p1 GENE.GFYU01009153.1~~GFYU01009153.1.p1  ORF type:complete len:103 (-),score=18.42 GFYU01009153.1:37-345(-)
MSWPVDLGVLKKMALTGIEYSGLSMEDKNKSILDFRLRWRRWLYEALDKVQYADIESAGYDPRWMHNLEERLRRNMCSESLPGWDHKAECQFTNPTRKGDPK